MNMKSNIRKRRKDRLSELRSVASDRYYNRNEMDWQEGQKYNDFPLRPVDGMWQESDMSWSDPYSAFERKRLEEDASWKSWMEPPTRRQFRWKWLISIVLYFAIVGLFQLNQPFASKGQAIITSALERDFPFEKVAVWYNQTFEGAASWLPTFSTKEGSNVNSKLEMIPVNGKVIQTFEQNGQGVVLQTDGQAPVSAFASGRVIFTGHTSDLGLTVMIQHADEVRSIYGGLKSVVIARNDWVEAGETFGRVAISEESNEAKLFFAIKKGEVYLDPESVISLD